MIVHFSPVFKNIAIKSITEGIHHDGVLFALRFPPKSHLITKSQSFTIPDNMDIIVLSTEGIQYFITPHNWTLLKNGETKFEKYLESFSEM